MRTQTLGLPGRWATLAALEAAAVQLLNYRYPDEYFSTYARRVRSLGEPDLAAAAQKFIRPSEVIWVIVGDLAQVEKGVRELNLGEVDAARRRRPAGGNELNSGSLPQITTTARDTEKPSQAIRSCASAVSCGPCGCTCRCRACCPCSLREPLKSRTPPDPTPAPALTAAPCSPPAPTRPRSRGWRGILRRRAPSGSASCD